MSTDAPMRGERTFLHDISSPISALQLNLSGVLEECEEKSLLPAELLGLLKAASQNADRIVEMVIARRNELIAAGVPSERGSK